MKKRIIIVGLVVLLGAIACRNGSDEAEELPDTFRGKVVGLADGDSFVMLYKNKEVRVRMHGIDAPEKGQDFSRKSKQYLSRLIYNKDVRVDVVDIDRYGRVVGEVYVDTLHVNQEMVRKGLAWHYEYYAPDDEELARLQDSARKRKLGLWQFPEPMPPWKWREIEREKRAAVESR